MYKRQQVLINDWLADHYKIVANKYDFSYSEVIRITMCLIALKNIEIALNKKTQYKKLDTKFTKIIKDININGNINAEEMHRLLAEIYSETKKAIEFWNKAQKD